MTTNISQRVESLSLSVGFSICQNILSNSWLLNVQTGSI